MHYTSRSTDEAGKNTVVRLKTYAKQPTKLSRNDKLFFENLPKSIEGYVRSSVRNGKALRLKYNPSKTVPNRIGWRTVLPIEVYSRRGVLYFLAWFLSGSSYSGLTGYRLFIVDNITNIEYLNGTGNFPIANTFANSSKANSIFEHLWHNGEIE